MYWKSLCSRCLAVCISQGYIQCQIFCSIIPSSHCLSDRRGDGAVQFAVKLTKFADVVKVGGPFWSRPKHLLLWQVGSSFSSDPSRICPDIVLNYARPLSIWRHFWFFVPIHPVFRCFVLWFTDSSVTWTSLQSWFRTELSSGGFYGSGDELAGSVTTGYDLFTGAWNIFSDKLTIKIFVDLTGTKQETFAEK